MDFIVSHEEAIPLHIGTEDGCELACDLIAVGHIGSPSMRVKGSEDDTVEMGFNYISVIYRMVGIWSSFGYFNSTDTWRENKNITPTQLSVIV